MAPLRRCVHQGCPSLVKHGRCPAHEKAYDQRRGTAQERGYTYEWAKYSKAWLRAHPLCGMRLDGKRHAEHSACTKAGRRVAAQCTDHIKAVAQGGAMFDAANHQSLCLSCNTTKAIESEGGFGR